jgi:hypothetical protein
MRYWDSSALIPLLVEQAASAGLRRVARDDPAVITWWATPVECASALGRLVRDDLLTAHATAAAMARLRAAITMWTELAPSPDVKEQAIRLTRVHALRAADALQLAAAIVAANFQPRSLEFVTLDMRQARAAEAEGFPLVPANIT